MLLPITSSKSLKFSFNILICTLLVLERFLAKSGYFLFKKSTAAPLLNCASVNLFNSGIDFANDRGIVPENVSTSI